MTSPKAEQYVVHCSLCDIYVAVGSYNQKLNNFRRHLLSGRHVANVSHLSMRDGGHRDFLVINTKFPNVFMHKGNCFVCHVCGTTGTLTLKCGGKKALANAERHVMGKVHKQAFAKNSSKITSFFTAKPGPSQTKCCKAICSVTWLY